MCSYLKKSEKFRQLLLIFLAMTVGLMARSAALLSHLIRQSSTHAKSESHFSLQMFW